MEDLAESILDVARALLGESAWKLVDECGCPECCGILNTVCALARVALAGARIVLTSRVFTQGHKENPC